MNVDDSGFDSDTKNGCDKINELAECNNLETLNASDSCPKSSRVDVLDEGDHEAESNLLEHLPEVECRGSMREVNKRKKRSWKPSALQQKLERQMEAARKHADNNTISQQPKRGFFSSNKNMQQTKSDQVSLLPADQQPLVMIDVEDSEDEFAVPHLSRETQREITRQLIKDGYNLDLEPDDEDLDLIPPKPMVDRCSCCQVAQCNQQ